MRVKISMTEEEIRFAIVEYIRNNFGVSVIPFDLQIEVKSKQNYKSEWEQAAIRLEADARTKES
jgi:hypothetical protein